MIALGGPKLKLDDCVNAEEKPKMVSMIALGGPKLKLESMPSICPSEESFNDSTGWA